MVEPLSSPPAAQPPPPLPQIQDQSLHNYLRTFALWCRHGFAAQLKSGTALPGILLQASDPPTGATPKVFMIQVTTAGAVIATAQPLGQGKP